MIIKKLVFMYSEKSLRLSSMAPKLSEKTLAHCDFPN